MTQKIGRDKMPEPTTSRVSLTLPSSLDSVTAVERAAEDFIERAGFAPDLVHDIVVAVHEAVINAVIHGNRYCPKKRVTVSFEANSECIILRIADQGEGLNTDDIPDPLAPENLLKSSGRGIFLIRNFVDEVHFCKLNPGTELTLVEYRRQAPPAD
jgi:serine/threonine-protein kinase RsbW